MLDVLAIADDLTGAMDTAAPFAARGVRVVVCEPSAAYPDADVLVIDTESRHLAPDEAARAVRAAIAGAPPSRRRFKKVDSTLRGNLVAEVWAAAVGTDGVVLAPAVPWQGRIVREGRVLVHGVPLEDTEYARDARSPAFTGDLATALGDGARVPDAATVDDLVRVAQDTPPGTLLAGAAGLAEAVAQITYGDPVEPARPPRPDRILVVVGSRTASARRQVVHLRDSAPDVEVLLAPDGDDDPDAVARALAEAAAAHPADALVLVGGDTAIAVLRAIGSTRLDVHGTVAGLPWATAHTRTGPKTVITKAGGFGDEDVLVGIVTTLRRSASDAGWS